MELENVNLREKARMPRAVHGDEWPMLVWGRHPKGFLGLSPQANSAFSLEEAPTCGRGSSQTVRAPCHSGKPEGLIRNPNPVK